MSSPLSIVTWNINGLRAIAKKDFLPWLNHESPDILCLQETKALPEQLPEEVVDIPGYQVHFASAKRRGYSGVALYSKIAPLEVELLGDDLFDDEGRALIAYYPHFTLINAYFPNSQEKGKRLSYKLEFCAAIREKCQEIESMGSPVIISGDYNIAHKPIDLAHPESNEENPGYLPQERAWMDLFLREGFVDAFREKNQTPSNYTWWSYRLRARDRNIGWRIDYHCTSSALQPHILSCDIYNKIMGSDHCPVRLLLSVPDTVN